MRACVLARLSLGALPLLSGAARFAAVPLLILFFALLTTACTPRVSLTQSAAMIEADGRRLSENVKPVILGAGPNEKVTTLTGYVPFPVSFRGVYSLHDAGDLNRCRGYAELVPITPKYNDAGQRVTDCIAVLNTAARRLNEKVLGNAQSVTAARYEWDMGVTPRTLNVPDSKKTFVIEKQEGFAASYIYDQPGTYYVQLRVTNSKREMNLAAPLKIVVLPRPANHRVVYISAKSGNDANAGTIEAPIKTLAKAQTFLAEGTRFVLKRGETYSVGATFAITQPHVYITAYGSADEKPLVIWRGPQTGGAIFTVNSDWTGPYTNKPLYTVIQNLTLDTDLKQVMGKEDYYEKAGIPNGVNVGSRGVALRNLTFRNVNYGVLNSGKSQDLFLLGNSAPLEHGIRGYFLWNEGINVHAIGNRCANSTREHCIRTTSVHMAMVVADNDLENKDLRGVDGPDFAKSTINIQAGSHFYVRNNRLTRGPVQLGPLMGGDGRGGGRVTTGVFDGNELDLTSRVFVEAATEDIVIRNNVIKVYDFPGIEVRGFDEDYRVGSRDVVVAHNTVDVVTANGRAFHIGSSSGLIFRNNLSVGQALDVGNYGASIVEGTETLVATFKDLGGNVFEEPHLSGGKEFRRTDPVNTTAADPGLNTIEGWNLFQQKKGFAPLDRYGRRGEDGFEIDANYRFKSTSEFLRTGAPPAAAMADKSGRLRAVTGTWAGAFEAQ